MKELPIKRNLSEETRVQTITIWGGVFDLHQGEGDDSCYYITKHAEEDTIYAMFSKEMFEHIFRSGGDKAEEQLGIKKVDVWYIGASTGCSCCQHENFIQGFYRDEKTPTDIVSEWMKGNGNPLASQYAKYGHYKVNKVEAEILPDGRVIMADNVFEAGCLDEEKRYQQL